MAHHEFTMPVSEAQVRALRVDDTVTLNGTLYGIRDATQIHMFDRGRKTRFDLSGQAVIHTAPNVRKVEKSTANPAGYAPLCIGTTTSDRMERFTRPLMQQNGVRLIIGKGGCATRKSFGELAAPTRHHQRTAALGTTRRGDRGRGLDDLNPNRWKFR
jgi:L(+)-tartrate dehydratase beta subunit